jgi:hypothetical protein
MVNKFPLMSMLNQDVHLLNYLIITSSVSSGEQIFLSAAAPDLLTRRLRIGDFFELRLKQKAHKSIL